MHNLDKEVRQVEATGVVEVVELTPDDVERFIASPYGRFIHRKIMVDLIAARDRLEIMGKDFDRNDISFIQGQISALRDIYETPDLLKQVQDADTKEMEQNDD